MMFDWSVGGSGIVVVGGGQTWPGPCVLIRVGTES